MLKNISRLEHIIGNKVYHLLCDSDCPIPEVKEALVQFLTYLSKVEESIKSAQEQQKLEEEKKEETVIIPEIVEDN